MEDAVEERELVDELNRVDRLDAFEEDAVSKTLAIKIERVTNP